jgi:hypothetical protein
VTAPGCFHYDTPLVCALRDNSELRQWLA